MPTSLMNRLTLPLLLALLPALPACTLWSPQPAAPSWELPQIAYEEFRLDNGLRVIVHEDRRSPIVAVNRWYHVGSKNERPGRTGFAHLFEHLMFNGSEHHDDEFFRPLEEVGATGMNGTTNEDRTNYFANVPTPALDRLLWLESDRMGHLLGAITQAKLDEQRGVVQNEKRQRENEPYGRVWDLIPSLAYPPGHPYSWTTIGSMEDLEAATLEDVKDWFRTWYGAANATLVIAGDVSLAEAREKVEHYFAGMPAGPALQRPARWEAPIPDARRATLQDQVPQARVYRVFNVAANYTPDALHLQLAAEILGGGKSSRLYERLVWKEQLATDVAAFIAPGELGSQWYLMATAREGVDPAQLEAALDAELERLRKNGPRPEELDRVRSALYASVVRGLERVGGFGGKSDQLASAAVIAGDPAMWSTELEWLRDARPEDVRDSLQRWLGEGHLTITVLPEPPRQSRPDSVDRSQLPAVAEPPPLRLPEWTERTLSNGLRVVVATVPNSPVTEYRWFRPGGTATDPQGQEGLSSLAADLLDEAAGGRDALDISRVLERNGASLSSGVSLDFTHLSLSTVKGLEAEPLTIFADVLTRPDLPPSEFQRRRELLKARVRQEQASPFALGLRALPPLLYGEDHPYGRPLTGSGTLASLESLDLSAVQDWARSRLQPQNATLLIVGDLDMEAAIASLPPRLLDWVGSGNDTPLQIPAAEQAKQVRIYLLDRPDAPQSVILAGSLVADRSLPENLALETANALYGGLFTSRLNMNLREDKHWAYGAGSALVDTQAQRPWVIYTRVESAQTAPAMREIAYELQRIRQPAAVAPAELAHATRNRALKLPGQHETTAQIAGSISHILQRQLPADEFATLPARLQALRPAQIDAAARSHWDSQQLQWVIIGDLRRIRPSIEALGWTEPVVLTQTP